MVRLMTPFALALSCLKILIFYMCMASSKVLPPVQPSQYASMGKIGQYVGHVNDLAGLKAAMAACSYKNEVILISTTSQFVDAAAQTIGMFRCVVNVCWTPGPEGKYIIPLDISFPSPT